MSLVRYESAGHVATITMDRTSAHNALNPALCNELCEAWRRFRDSDDRVAVLASAEDAYFCVGADVRDFPADMWRAVPGLGVELDKPVIAATSGWVVGGGFVLVQMADMCVASETTRFSYPEVKGRYDRRRRLVGAVADAAQDRDGISSGRRRDVRATRLRNRFRQQGGTQGAACRAGPGDGREDRRRGTSGGSGVEEGWRATRCRRGRWRRWPKCAGCSIRCEPAKTSRKASRPSAKSASRSSGASRVPEAVTVRPSAANN